MLKGQREIRIIWLMMLIIIAVSAWFLDARILTYICGLAFVMSVMQYVDAIQDPLQQIAQQTRVPLQSTSKVPLYVSSIIAVVGLTLHLSWMVGLGLTAWIFFFLRWLRRLERYLSQVQLQIQHLNLSEQQSPDLNNPSSICTSESIQSLSNTVHICSRFKKLK